MPVTFVTALYIVKNNVYRGPEFYLERLEQLIKTGVPLLCYMDKTLEAEGEALKTKYPNFQIPSYVQLDTSWVPEDVVLPTHRHEPKDTVSYFCIQLQKLWCLNDARDHTTTSHVAWIDAGIFYLFDDKEAATTLLKTIASSSWPEAILAPGCYTRDYVIPLLSHSHFLNSVIWNYAGSFLLCHRDHVGGALKKQTEVVLYNLPRLGWEVNYWSEMNLFTWYYADHNLSLLTNLMPLRIVLADST